METLIHLYSAYNGKSIINPPDSVIESATEIYNLVKDDEFYILFSQSLTLGQFKIAYKYMTKNYKMKYTHNYQRDEYYKYFYGHYGYITDFLVILSMVCLFSL